MTQITINIENKSIVPHLKKILSSIEGVSIARTARSKGKATGVDKALKEARTGYVNHYSSADDMFQKLGI